MTRTYIQTHHTDNYSQHSSITYTSDFAPVWSKKFLQNQVTIEFGLTLKRVPDMTRPYSQLHRANKYSQHSSKVWSVWLNSWVFLYKLSGCRFEFSCNHLNFIFVTCFVKIVPWHSGKYRKWIHSETFLWHEKNILKDTIQISTHNTAQSLGQFGGMV